MALHDDLTFTLCRELPNLNVPPTFCDAQLASNLSLIQVLSCPTCCGSASCVTERGVMVSTGKFDYNNHQRQTPAMRLARYALLARAHDIVYRVLGEQHPTQE
jgi:hypothetical protein